ncbi:MAG: ATP-binding protein [Anaerolineae bacterium]|nr:ATP-binding protein [Anaerolineae bacterium]
MRSLRTRLIVSHLLPLIILTVVVGVALTYLLQTQVLLAERSNELELQAYLVAEAASQNPLIWYDDYQAEAFTSRIGARLSAQVMLLSPEGLLKATNSTDFQAQIGQVLKVPGLQETVQSRSALRINYNNKPGTGGAEVLMPVIAPTWQVIGVIRLIDPLSSVYGRFTYTRNLIIAVLIGGFTLGGTAGALLAVDISRPLRRATQEIARMAEGQPLSSLPEQGPREVRSLLRAFNSLTQELHNLEKSRMRLLANLVHEIGRPLGALFSATQALEAGADQDPVFRDELLQGMKGEIQRMQSLLDDLTRLYDHTQRPLSLNLELISFSDWLNKVLGPWREAALEKNLVWELDYPSTIPDIYLDPDRAAQALGNIVSNAIKYTPEEGAVHITADSDRKYVWIRVADTGSGIPPEEIAQIFEPFYRGSTSHRFPQGMGLGLSIARDLIQAHRGYITVESTPGKGSVFTLWIPRNRI